MDESQRCCFEQKKPGTQKTKNCMILFTWNLLMGRIIYSVKSEQCLPIGARGLTGMVLWELSGIDGQLLILIGCWFMVYTPEKFF